MRRRATVMVRGVVSRWRAVSSLRRPGVGHLFRMELSAALSKSPLKQDPPRAHSAKPGLEWATADPPREERREKLYGEGLIWAYLVHLGAAGFPCSGSKRALSIHAVYQRFSSICDPAASRCSVTVRASGQPLSLKR